MNLLRRRSLTRKQTVLTVVAVGLIVAGFARVVSDLHLLASSEPIGFEAESGRLAGSASIVARDGASGGNAVQFGGQTAAATGVPQVIFDADMSSDWDDMGAIALLEALADLGECKIIGMMVSSTNGGTGLAMDAVNTFYGRPGIPVGVRPDVAGAGGYPGNIISKYPHPTYPTIASLPKSVDLYRQLLAKAPDGSVTIISTGYLTNLKALLQSGPDQYSALNGIDLVRQKVKLLSAMGGWYPQGDEFNFRSSGDDSTYHVVNNWPTAVAYGGFELGAPVATGSLLKTAVNGPTKDVWAEHNFEPHASWDQISVYYAIRPQERVYDLYDLGRNTARLDGHNAWVASPDPNGAQNQGYLLERARYQAQMGIDVLMAATPKAMASGRPTAPTNLRGSIDAGRTTLQWTDNSYNENSFKLERRINGIYTTVATLPANTTTYVDAGAPAGTRYRIKAVGSQGESPESASTIYSGWTETNFDRPAGVPMYSYYGNDNLRWARGGDDRPNHVAVNNDTIHGTTLSVDVKVAEMGSSAKAYLYFFYNDKNNWYRISASPTATVFEKSVNGTISRVGQAGAGVRLGEVMTPWHLSVSPSGAMSFSSNGTVVASAADTYSFSSGKVGLGGATAALVWAEFTHDTSGK